MMGKSSNSCSKPPTSHPFHPQFSQTFLHDFGGTEGAPQDICHAIRALRCQLLALWQVLDGPRAARKSIGKSWGKLEKPMGRSWEYGNYHRNSDDLSVYCDLKVGIDGNIAMKNGGGMGFSMVIFFR